MERGEYRERGVEYQGDRVEVPLETGAERGGLEYLGEGGWSTWERRVGVPGR